MRFQVFCPNTHAVLRRGRIILAGGLRSSPQQNLSVQISAHQPERASQSTSAVENLIQQVRITRRCKPRSHVHRPQGIVGQIQIVVYNDRIIPAGLKNL